MTRTTLLLTCLLAVSPGLRAGEAPPVPKQEAAKPRPAQGKAAVARKQARMKAKAAADAKSTGKPAK